MVVIRAWGVIGIGGYGGKAGNHRFSGGKLVIFLKKTYDFHKEIWSFLRENL